MYSFEKMKLLLKKELLNGRKSADWGILAIGLFLQFAAVCYGYYIGEPDDLPSVVCAFSGVFTVILCAQRKISYYLFNFIQMFTYVFWVVLPNRLYGEAVEYVFYFLTTVFGIYVWYRGYGCTENDSIEYKAKKLNEKQTLICSAVLILGTLIGYVILKQTDDPLPFIDAISTIPAFMAQILMCAGYREQWVCWCIIDVASVIMFAQVGNLMMVSMFIFWTINCIYGWIRWTESNRYKGWKEIV